MGYDSDLAERIRRRIGDHPGIVEKKMFGGLAFLVGGHMAVGVVKDEMVVRVGQDAHDDAVARPGARTMDFTTRPMRGWISVSPQGCAADDALDAWVDQGLAYAARLPSK